MITIIIVIITKIGITIIFIYLSKLALLLSLLLLLIVTIIIFIYIIIRINIRISITIIICYYHYHYQLYIFWCFFPSYIFPSSASVPWYTAIQVQIIPHPPFLHISLPSLLSLLRLLHFSLLLLFLDEANIKEEKAMTIKLRALLN